MPGGDTGDKTMSIKENLGALVQVQTRELELVRIAGEITAIETNREALRAQVADAEAVVSKAEKDVEDARAEAKRLDLVNDVVPADGARPARRP